MNGKRKLNLLKNTLLVSVILLAFIPRGNAQDLQPVQAAFNKYTQSTLQEKIFVHTDKSTYLAGEIVWFKIYCVDGAFNKPLTLSKVVYVDILDNAQVSVMQAKIAMADGMGSGSLVIPPSVANGNYKLRAYTNWMKNFGPEGFFEKKITIVNSLRSPDLAAKPKTPDYDVQFFPEGGYLVSGLAANVAFKAVAKNGMGVTFRGAVVNDNNDTVARFKPLKFGMARFAFTPAANSTYRAVINIGSDKPIVTTLPVVENNGYTMQVTDAGNGSLNVKVNNNTGDQPLYLFAHTRGVAKLVQSAVSSNGAAQFTVSKDKLDEGVSSLTIFDGGKQPVCERLYFKRPKQALFINAGADAGQYATRKKVSVTVAAKNAANKMINAGLSMSVYRVDSLQTVDQDDIASYFWLGAELKGSIESPGYYLKNTTAEIDEATDNLLLTQGWRRFRWDNILQANPAAFKYLPEFNGHLVIGKVTDSVKNIAKDVIAFLAVPGKRVQVYAAKSDAEGKLYFNTKEFYGPSEIVVQTNTERDTSHKIEVISPFSEQYSKTTLPAFGLTPGMQTSLQQQSLGMQVQNIYAGNKLKHYFEPVVDSTGFFGIPYKTYKLDDFTRFVTMEEVVREYVREAGVSRSRGRFHITLIDEKAILTGDPLVMLDGVPVFNIDKVMAIDPLKVQRLQVLRSRYFWGPAAFEGIMNYTTYKGDLGGAEMDPHAVVIDYEGMQVQREFYSPIYETDEQTKSRIPDFRNLLFWAPEINTGPISANKVTFYTSDQAGRYFGIVQGMAANGDAASQSFTFEVK
ncbi:hypothetical protein [Mucilaginibacter gilvus]|uniref:MG2 domain-containing protein n=1 Tax=Mucilaginibacter gilvus TaxID=2305909 RepID=A0A444MH53_9SPHI|nr:hypothetical protein [Mucilaginibacter gilvus]RWY46004.1 hypothetical protein EPL05_23440 [Mucilaginibacter gilvus]